MMTTYSFSTYIHFYSEIGDKAKVSFIVEQLLSHLVNRRLKEAVGHLIQE